MTEAQRNPLDIQIGDQIFRIRATPEESVRFERIAKRVNDILSEIQHNGVVGGPRSLAMAAFQLGVDLEDRQEALQRSEQNRSRLLELIRRIDQATEAGVGKPGGPDNA